MLHATVPAADGVMYSDMTRQRIGEIVQQTRDALAAKSRSHTDYRISNIWAWHIKPDRETARREARRELLLRGLLDRWYLEAFLSADDCALVEREKRAFFQAYRDHSGVIAGVPGPIIDALLANLTFTGTPDEIAGRLPELLAFQQAGVNELCFRLHDDPGDAIRLIGERVIPALAASC
jgi:alkanesulfonate monooxygenase SsuD/methylene tetrahydromethanopterin reductase-like flavin-dependent oxidoreductase (luciferase family)